jgi:hypothetical protein
MGGVLACRELSDARVKMDVCARSLNSTCFAGAHLGGLQWIFAEKGKRIGELGFEMLDLLQSSGGCAVAAVSPNRLIEERRERLCRVSECSPMQSSFSYPQL